MAPPYVKTNWQAGVTPLSEANMDHLETQYDEAKADLDAQFALNIHFVSGLIVIWHGTIANIPAGFVICDGNNSTPNLLTKFIQGVATAGTDPGATGGAATHTLSVAELASHSHTIRKGADTGAGIASDTDRYALVADFIGDTGGDGAHENEPTFYDVAFIMKT